MHNVYLAVYTTVYNSFAAYASVYTRQAVYTISHMKHANRCRVDVYTTTFCDITPTVSTSWAANDSCKPRLSLRLLNAETTYLSCYVVRRTRSSWNTAGYYRISRNLRRRHGRMFRLSISSRPVTSTLPIG